jgi:hypothetical protein
LKICQGSNNAYQNKNTKFQSYGCGGEGAPPELAAVFELLAVAA